MTRHARTLVPSLLLTLVALAGCPGDPVVTPTESDTDTDTDADTDTDTDADTDSDTDTDTDADTDSDTDADTDPAGSVYVTGLGSVLVPMGGDYFDTTANGIVPFSFSRHTLTIHNDTAAAITIDDLVSAPTDGFDLEWSLIETGLGDITELDLAGTTIPAGGAESFDIYFTPVESGLTTEEVTLTWDGTESYGFTITGRGRDALLLFSDGELTEAKVHGDPDADTLTGASDLDASDNLYYSGNVNEWSDGFSENIVVSRQNADGTLAWSKEWAESYEQLSPDPGQNGESGGSADSLDYADGKVYVVGHRSQSASNSVFQALAMKVDATTGAMDWAVGYSGHNVDPPALGWHSAQAYAVDATLSDRILVAGASFSNAEVLLMALSKTDGSLLWSRSIDLVSGSNDRAHSLAVDASGNAWLGGISNGRGFVARVTGVDGATPALDFAKKLDMGVGSNVNAIDLDSAGNAYLSLDRRGAQTFLSVARMSTTGTIDWAKTWDEGNAGDNNNSYVVRVDGSHVYLGGRVAVATADTQFGEGFLMRLATADGAYDWGTLYYTGKGAEEVVENRLKGINVDSAGDLRLLMQNYAVSLNFEHYWGYWYDLQDDPMADLSLGEDPGDGALLLTDYTLAPTDLTATAAFRDASGAYNGTNVATVFTIDTASIWQDTPTAVVYEDTYGHEGNGVDGDNVLMKVDLY